MKKSLANISVLFIMGLNFVACGSGGGSSESGDNIQLIKYTTLNSPLKALVNTYQINFEGDGYLKFKTDKSSKFLFVNSGIEYYGKSEILDLNGTVTSYTSGDILPQGEYILKIHSDTNLDENKPFVTMISKDFNYTKIYNLPLKDNSFYNVLPSFKSFFTINIEQNYCLEIEGSYQDIKLYDLNLTELEYDLDNHTECNIPVGEYILYYSNHTIYPNSFVIHYTSY